MLKSLVIIFNQNQLYFYYKTNQKWQLKQIAVINLENFTEYLKEIPQLMKKTSVYFILDSIYCSQITIENPSFKLDHQTRGNLIHYHLSEKETSTHFHYDYKTDHKNIKVAYACSDFIQSLIQPFKENNLKFIGFNLQLQIEALNCNFNPNILLIELNKNTTSVFNLLPWRTTMLITVKKQIFYGVCLFLLFALILPFLVRIFWLEQQKQSQQQLFTLTQLEQQQQVKLYEINTQLNFFEQNSEIVAQIQKKLTLLTEPFVNGIWLTTLSKNKKEWLLEGKTLAEFLIHDLIEVYQQQFPAATLNFEIENKPSFFIFKIKLQEQ